MSVTPNETPQLATAIFGGDTWEPTDQASDQPVTLAEGDEADAGSPSDGWDPAATSDELVGLVTTDSEPDDDGSDAPGDRPANLETSSAAPPDLEYKHGWGG